MSSQGVGRVAYRNQMLSTVLEDAGWSCARVAGEVNRCMGSDYIGRSTVSEWVNKGRVPREPLPTVVAHVLSEAAGRKISVTELWGRPGAESSLWVSVDEGYPMPKGFGVIIGIAQDWITYTGESMDVDRRELLAVSGTTLTGVAWKYAQEPLPSGPWALQKNAYASNGVRITPGIVTMLETQVEGLKKLDNHEGGNRDTLRIAHRYFHTMAEYVKTGAAVDAPTQQRLLRLWVTLCAFAGSMALDAQLYGLAQRYWFTGLHVTHATGDAQFGAGILGYLCFQAAHRGHGHDAAQLGEAAMKMAEKGDNAAVQALVTSRYAEAQAALGNESACRTAIDEARNLLATPGALASKPPYMSWFDTRMLASQNGRSLLTLAQRNPRASHALIEHADTLLTPHVSRGSEFAQDFQRDALFWGAWHARSYVWRNELEHAAATGTTLIDLSRSVRSQRCTAVLRQLHTELTQRRGALHNPRVAEFSRKLTAAITTAAKPPSPEPPPFRGAEAPYQNPLYDGASTPTSPAPPTSPRATQGSSQPRGRQPS